MFKKLLAMMVSCILLLSIVAPASADTVRYCAVCNGRTTFRDSCYGSLKYNTAYMQHPVSSLICNYYKSYFKTQQNCISCGNLYDPNTSHLHEEIHEFCPTEYHCPF